MKRVVVVGGGEIGSTIADFLAATGDYAVTVVDRDQDRLGQLVLGAKVERRALDVTDKAALAEVMTGAFAVISAAPFHLTIKIAEAAHAAGAHYFDLTEDVASTRAVKALAETAKSAFMPQCGLAPGFIAIAGADMGKRFDSLDELRLRVGALPRYPSNALGYNLTWSTEGVVNEYCEPCEAIVGGVRREVPAMEEYETFTLDGIVYEAFNTSGGLGSLSDTLAGKVRNLNYRTIRYPGHAALMKVLLNDLRLSERRAMLKDILEHAVPRTLQDVVVVFVTASGYRNGAFLQESYAHKVFAAEIGGVLRSAIQITTAAGVCAVVDMVASGQLPQQGFIRQEEVAFADFLANRFGRLYAPQSVRAEAA
jgi:saccharopine dehydrogenase-like NADP-dependent oxidoreductase